MNYNTNDPEAVAMREKMERLKKYNKIKIFDVISIEEVRKFEEENNIKLPDDYVWFITNVANGCTESSGGYNYELSCGFYPLESTEFSSEYIEADKWEDHYGEEKFSLNISSTGCTGSYGIFLKGEHYGEISDNDEGLAYYEPKRVHGFKEWYNLLLDVTLSGHSRLDFDRR
ncbi:MAG: SMI1/KNR4 family protein [Ruminococcus flavefaciens]|nr:SMI1/KNR4 family protein [Ruminococcus flavefaciens]